jgi:adenylate kinase
MNKNKKVIFITGTPGVGKTTVAEYLNKELNEKYDSKLLKINEIATQNNLIQGKDIERGYQIVDIDKLNKKIYEIINNDNFEVLIVEGHLSHLCDHCDKIIVLRLKPKLLEKRLEKRDYSKSKIQENLEAESLAVCSVEAFENHGDIVNEIDTTDMSIEEVVVNIRKIISGEKNFPIGEIDFMDWLMK